MKASSQLSQSLLGSLLIGEDDYNRKSPENVTPSRLARKMCSVVNRWNSLEEERND